MLWKNERRKRVESTRVWLERIGSILNIVFKEGLNEKETFGQWHWKIGSFTDILRKSISVWWKSKHNISETGGELAYLKNSKEAIMCIERTWAFTLGEMESHWRAEWRSVVLCLAICCRVNNLAIACSRSFWQGVESCRSGSSQETETTVVTWENCT